MAVVRVSAMGRDASCLVCMGPLVHDEERASDHGGSHVEENRHGGKGYVRATEALHICQLGAGNPFSNEEAAISLGERRRAPSPLAAESVHEAAESEGRSHSHRDEEIEADP